MSGYGRDRDCVRPGVVFAICIVHLRIESTAPPQMLRDAPHDSPEHFADFARLQMTERVPYGPSALVVERAVEKHRMQVWTQAQVACHALRHRDRAALGLLLAMGAGSLCVEPQHRAREDARQVAEQSSVVCQPGSPRERERPYPLA